MHDKSGCKTGPAWQSHWYPYFRTLMLFTNSGSRAVGLSDTADLNAAACLRFVKAERVHVTFS
jgi:hypothetical protein